MLERVKFVSVTRTIDPKTHIHYLDAVDSNGDHWMAQMRTDVEKWIVFSRVWYRDPHRTSFWSIMTSYTKELQMAIDTSTSINIFSGNEWHYSVDDTNIEVGCDGCTISYWYDQKRNKYITMTDDEALALADAIYKLFKKNPGWCQ